MVSTTYSLVAIATFNPTGATSTPTMVNVSVAGGTAIAGTDYETINDFTITIPAGMSAGADSFDLVVIGDTVAEGNETVTFSGTAAGFTINNVGTVVTIADDDTAPTGIALSLNPTSVTENSGTTPVAVTAAFSGSSSTLTTATEVTVSVAGGTATGAGTDFADVTDFTLTIPATMTSGTASFDLVVTDDTLVEGDETVTISASTTATGFTAIPDATLTIVDDDIPNVTLADVTVGEEAGTVTVTATLDVAVREWLHRRCLDRRRHGDRRQRLHRTHR